MHWSCCLVHDLASVKPSTSGFRHCLWCGRATFRHRHRVKSGVSGPTPTPIYFKFNRHSLYSVARMENRVQWATQHRIRTKTIDGFSTRGSFSVGQSQSVDYLHQHHCHLFCFKPSCQRYSLCGPDINVSFHSMCRGLGCRWSFLTPISDETTLCLEL